MALFETVTPHPIAARIDAILDFTTTLTARIAAHRAEKRNGRILHAMTDAELSDLAIGRSEISYAVRHGR